VRLPANRPSSIFEHVQKRGGGVTGTGTGARTKARSAEGFYPERTCCYLHGPVIWQFFAAHTRCRPARDFRAAQVSTYHDFVLTCEVT